MQIYNLRLNKIVESINVKVDETNVLKTWKERKNSKVQEPEEQIKEEEDEELKEKQPEAEQEETKDNQQDLQTPSKTPKRWYQKNHPPKQIIGDKKQNRNQKQSNKHVHQNKDIYHYYPQLNQAALRKPTMMNIGSRPWKKN
jgi:hypothetical protein